MLHSTDDVTCLITYDVVWLHYKEFTVTKPNYFALIDAGESNIEWVIGHNAALLAIVNVNILLVYHSRKALLVTDSTNIQTKYRTQYKAAA